MIDDPEAARWELATAKSYFWDAVKVNVKVTSLLHLISRAVPKSTTPEDRVFCENAQSLLVEAYRIQDKAWRGQYDLN